MLFLGEGGSVLRKILRGNREMFSSKSSTVLVPLDLPIWLTCVIFGVRARAHGTCVPGLVFYVCFTGLVNIFLTVCRTIACGAAAMLTGFQVFVNAIFLVFLILPYFFDHVQLGSDIDCDDITLSAAISVLLAQLALILVGSVFLYRRCTQKRIGTGGIPESTTPA